MKVTDADWDDAVRRARARINTEIRLTSTPPSIGVPIAARAISILGQELGIVKVGGDTLAQMETDVINEAVDNG